MSKDIQTESTPRNQNKLIGGCSLILTTRLLKTSCFLFVSQRKLWNSAFLSLVPTNTLVPKTIATYMLLPSRGGVVDSITRVKKWIIISVARHDGFYNVTETFVTGTTGVGSKDFVESDVKTRDRILDGPSTYYRRVIPIGSGIREGRRHNNTAIANGGDGCGERKKTTRNEQRSSWRKIKKKKNRPV